MTALCRLVTAMPFARKEMPAVMTTQFVRAEPEAEIICVCANPVTMVTDVNLLGANVSIIIMYFEVYFKDCIGCN